MKPKPKPKRRVVNIPVPLEWEETRVLVQWMTLRRMVYLHVPNEGERTPRAWAIMRLLGASKGAPDLLVFSRPPRIPSLCGVAIEMKRQRGGRIAPAQEAWLDALKELGWYIMLPKGAHEAIRELEGLGY